MNINVKLRPWQTPNFINGEMPVRPRQEGFIQDGPKWSLKEVGPEVLSQMCDTFRAEIFKKAGVVDPRISTKLPRIK